MKHLTESVERLDMLSTPKPAQGMLQRLSIAASQDFMEHFYDYSLLVIFITTRGLPYLHTIVNRYEVGNGLRYFENQEEGPQSNDPRFLGLVDCELSHVKEVTVEDSTTVDDATGYGAAFSQVLSALKERNKAWVEP